MARTTGWAENEIRRMYLPRLMAYYHAACHWEGLYMTWPGGAKDQWWGGVMDKRRMAAPPDDEC